MTRYLLAMTLIAPTLAAGAEPDPAKDDPLGYWAERLPNADAKVRMQAVIELGKLGDKAVPAVPGIADRLQTDKDARVRLAAAGVLGKIGPKAADGVPALIGALKDEGFDVCPWSATALGNIGPGAKAAVPPLTEMLKSNISSRAYTAARALGKIGPDAKSAVPELLRVVRENPHSIAAEAAESLWQIDKHPEAIPALIKLLKDSSSSSTSKGAAAESLGRIGPPAKAAVHELLDALRDDRSLIAVKAALALWQIEEHKNAIPFLIDQLKHRDETERYHACWRLAAIGPPAKAAIPALEAALKDSGNYVAQYAAEALEKIEGKKR